MSQIMSCWKSAVETRTPKDIMVERDEDTWQREEGVESEFVDISQALGPAPLCADPGNFSSSPSFRFSLVARPGSVIVTLPHVLKYATHSRNLSKLLGVRIIL